MVTTTLQNRALPVQSADPRGISTASPAEVAQLLNCTSDALDSDFAMTLLAIAGHDLRQPLQVITSAHEQLLPMLDSEKERAELAFAAQATARLVRMLDQLVEALHLHRQAGNSLSRPVKLSPLLKRLSAEFDWLARVKGADLSFRTAPDAVLSHPVLLTGILRNLIHNAIDYTPTGGTVSVHCHRRGSDVRIEVRDTGFGIQASALPRIFDAFERADESRSDGLGLGLFIVKRAAELLGHRVEVHSVEGTGSRFTVVTRAARFDASDAKQPRYQRFKPRRTVATINQNSPS